MTGLFHFYRHLYFTVARLLLNPEIIQEKTSELIRIFWGVDVERKSETWICFRKVSPQEIISISYKNHHTLAFRLLVLGFFF